MSGKHRYTTTAQHDTRWPVHFMSVLVMLTFLAACGRMQRAAPSTGSDGYTVTLATEPAATEVGQSIVVVTLKDGTGKPVDNAQLTIEGNMTHAGMVPVTGQVAESRDGIYRVPFEFTMSGDWLLDVVFAVQGGQTVTRRFPVSVR
jgi:hypothetical protein